MDGILLVIAAIFILRIIHKGISNAVALEKNKLQELIVPVKVCPPHAWHWVEVKDTEGTIMSHKVVCERCGPIKPLN